MSFIVDTSYCDQTDRRFVEIQNDDKLAVKSRVQSLTVAFLEAYCDSNSVEIILVRKETTEKLPSIQRKALKGYQVNRWSYQNIPEVVQECTLPTILSTDGCSVRSGLCGTFHTKAKSQAKAKLAFENFFDLFHFRSL